MPQQSTKKIAKQKMRRLGTYICTRKEETYAYLADNAYIHTGYRLNYTIEDCAKSIFQWHNETLNVWTHMIGSFIFIGLFVALLQWDPLHILYTHREGQSGGPICSLSEMPYAIGGRHTVRMLLSHSLDYVGRLSCSPIHRRTMAEKAYTVASEIFAGCLNRLPDLSQPIFSNSGTEMSTYVFATLQAQRDSLYKELLLFQSKIQALHASGAEWITRPASNRIAVLRAHLMHRLGLFLHYTTEATKLASAAEDRFVRYSLHEYGNVAESIRVGLQALSGVDSILENQDNIPKWPIYVFIFSAVFCLGSSTVFHLMYVHSQKLYFLLSRLDYAGIAILIAGSFYPLIYYGFYCEKYVAATYLACISIMSVLTFFSSLMPRFSTPEYLLARTLSFFGLAMFGVVPIGHMIVQFGFFHEEVQIIFIPLMYMALLYCTGAVFYATRFPERCSPGTFDRYCSSHQLWHVCVVLAALVHFNTSVKHYEFRMKNQCIS